MIIIIIVSNNLTIIDYSGPDGETVQLIWLQPIVYMLIRVNSAV